MHTHRLCFSKSIKRRYTKAFYILFTAVWPEGNTRLLAYIREPHSTGQYRTQNTFTQAKGQINVRVFFSLSLKSRTWLMLLLVLAMAKTRSSFCVHGRAGSRMCMHHDQRDFKKPPFHSYVADEITSRQHTHPPIIPVPAAAALVAANKPPDRRFKVLKACAGNCGKVVCFFCFVTMRLLRGEMIVFCCFLFLLFK